VMTIRAYSDVMMLFVGVLLLMGGLLNGSWLAALIGWWMTMGLVSRLVSVLLREIRALTHSGSRSLRCGAI
jgi:hypothetical protein